MNAVSLSFYVDVDQRMIITWLEEWLLQAGITIILLYGTKFIDTDEM